MDMERIPDSHLLKQKKQIKYFILIEPQVHNKNKCDAFIYINSIWLFNITAA